MMRGYKCGLLLILLPCWVPMAVADPAVSGVAASAVKAIPSPEEDYQAAIKADKAGEVVEAVKLFKRAADRGHAAAQLEVGEIIKYGSGFKMAVEYYHKSAEQGYAAGQLGLGLVYTEPGVYQDFAEARKWVILAADQEYAPAIHEMARSYILGGMGLDENARSGPDALKWIKRAADIKYPLAIQTLADAYRLGKYGLEIDLKQAGEWDAKYKEAAGIKNVKKKSTKSR